MKQSIFKITSNEKIARDIFKNDSCGDTSAITAPGQFVNIKLDGFFLRARYRSATASEKI